MKLSDYVDNLASEGKHFFLLEEAKHKLRVSKKALLASLNRLQKKAEIASPYHGFYIIIPRKYRAIGCLPPEQFIPQLMVHLNLPYYVCLLSAAQFYAAAHQQPQNFQVMTNKNRTMIQCGKVRVRFIAKQSIDQTPIKQMNTPTGVIKVSTPEATAVDLVCYPRRSGGLNNVATILSELIEVISPTAFQEMLNPITEIPCLQRLGYLMTLIGANDIAGVITNHLKKFKLHTVRLVPHEPMKGAPRDKQWAIAINSKVELDL